MSLHSKGWLWNSRVVEPSTMNTNFTSVDDTFEHEKPLESKRACFKAKFYLPPTLYPGTNYFLKLSSKGSWFKISSSKRVIVVQHRDPNDTSDHGDFNSPINRKSGAFLSLERNFLHIALLFFYLPWYYIKL